MKKMISAARYLSSSRTWMAAESSTPRTSMIDIFPLSGKSISNQRQSGAAVSGATNSADQRGARLIFLKAPFLRLEKEKAGGVAGGINCSVALGYLGTAFGILEGNLL